MIDLSRVPPAPRQVHRRASLGFFFGPARFFTILLMLSAVAMTALVFRYVLTMAYGTDVTGQIVHHGIVRHKNSYTHYLDYQYPEGGGWLRGSDQIRPTHSEDSEKGMPLTVRILRVGPIVGSAIPQDLRVMVMSHASFIVTSAALIFMAIALGWHFYLLPFRYRHLLRDGEAVIGKIVERTARITDRRRYWWKMGEPIEDPYGDRPTVYTLKYEYPLPSGIRRKSSMKVGMGDYGEVQCGDEVMVFYDPQRPRYSVIYPFEDDVIAGMEPQDEEFETAA